MYLRRWCFFLSAILFQASSYSKSSKAKRLRKILIREAINVENALETIALHSRLLTDQTGHLAATASRQMTGFMGKFRAQEEKKLKTGDIARVDKETVERFNKASKFFEKWEIMRDVPGLLAQYFDTLRESVGRKGIVEFITSAHDPKTRAGSIFADIQEKIMPLSESGPVFRDFIKEIELATGDLQALRGRKALEDVRDIESARTVRGQARDIFDDVIKKVDLQGRDFIQHAVMGMSLKGDYSPQKVIAVLEEQRDLLAAAHGQLGDTATMRSAAAFNENITRLNDALVELRMLAERSSGGRFVERQAGKPQAPVQVEVVNGGPGVPVAAPAENIQ